MTGNANPSTLATLPVDHWNRALRAAREKFPSSPVVRVQLAQGRLFFDGTDSKTLIAARDTVLGWLREMYPLRTFRPVRSQKKFGVWYIGNSSTKRAALEIERTEQETTEIVLAHPAAWL